MKSAPLAAEAACPSVFLIGMMGCGKSSVGRALARVLGLPFFDADKELVKRLGQSVEQIFEAGGEGGFRDHEERQLDILSQGPPRVLACGGGAVLRPINCRRLRERGCVVYLRTEREVLLRRLVGGRRRPLLQGVDVGWKIDQILSQRSALYEETAHEILDTGRDSVLRLAHRLRELLEAGQCQPVGGGERRPPE